MLCDMNIRNVVYFSPKIFKKAMWVKAVPITKQLFLPFLEYLTLEQPYKLRLQMYSYLTLEDFNLEQKSIYLNI